jgi:hypothetical protein
MNLTPHFTLEELTAYRPQNATDGTTPPMKPNWRTLSASPPSLRKSKLPWAEDQSWLTLLFAASKSMMLLVLKILASIALVVLWTSEYLN